MRRKGNARRQFAPHDEQHARVVVFRPDGKLQPRDAQVGRRLGGRRFGLGPRGRRRLRCGQRPHVGNRVANVSLAEFAAKAGHGVGQSRRGAAVLDDEKQVRRRAALRSGRVRKVARWHRQHACHASAAAVRAVAVDAQAFVDGFARGGVRL